MRPGRKIDTVLHALGDPTRRALVERLRAGPLSVSQLAGPLGVSVTAVGQHVQVLEASGLVRSEKTGRVRSCSLDPAGFNLLQFWIAEQSTAWEGRFAKLGKLLEEE